MIILAEITPYDPALSAEVTVRLSSGAVVPNFNGQLWRARLADVLSLGMSIFEDGFETAGSSRTAGGIQVMIGDGDVDEFTTYHWEQRHIKIWTGETNNFADFTLRFDGFISGVRFDEKVMDLTLADKSNVFDQPVQFPTYGGTGGTDGPSEMTDAVKPYCFGPVFNMEPTLVDAVNLIYQVHNRQTQAITGVFDQAVALTSDGDTVDLSLWVAIPGKYKTDLSKGLFKLGAKPAGLITADVQGDAFGGYVSSAGDIVQRLIQFIPDSTAVVIDAAAFTALNLANNSAVSIHARAALNARDLFNICLRSIGGYWLVDWLGNLTVGIHGISTPVASLNQQHIAFLSREDTPPPLWRLKTTYRPTYRVQNGSEIAAADLGGGIRSGAGVPAATLGIVDDLYIDSNNGFLYKKTAISIWTFQYDTTGPIGSTGAAGTQGIQGIQGTQGVAGTPGADGTPRYIWVAYANSADGATGFTTGAPAGHKYMGLATNKTTAIESINPLDYIWNLVEGPIGSTGAAGTQGIQGTQGTQGVAGTPGADGTPRYIWVAYANSADGATGFTTGAPAGHKYMGLAANKTTAIESINPLDYNWSKIEGIAGATGTTGSTGATGPQGPIGPNGAYVTYRQASAPASPINGEIWFETDTNILWFRQAAAWVSIGTYNTGALADLNVVNTTEIIDAAVTDVTEINSASTEVTAQKAPIYLAWVSNGFYQIGDRIHNAGQAYQVTSSIGNVYLGPLHTVGTLNGYTWLSAYPVADDPYQVMATISKAFIGNVAHQIYVIVNSTNIYSWELTVTDPADVLIETISSGSGSSAELSFAVPKIYSTTATRKIKFQARSIDVINHAFLTTHLLLLQWKK